jgi:hypothetical protein
MARANMQRGRAISLPAGSQWVQRNHPGGSEMGWWCRMERAATLVLPPNVAARLENQSLENKPPAAPR